MTNWPAYFIRQASEHKREIHAALAHPEPAGEVTDEELDKLERMSWKVGSSIEIEPEGIREVLDRDETFDHRAFARAAIAMAVSRIRWRWWAADHKKGLHGKYIIHRSCDGSPIDYPCFVLRIDGSDPAAMAAMRAYAEDPACPPELAGDLAVYCAIPASVPAAEGELAELVEVLEAAYEEAIGDGCPITAARFARAAALLQHHQPPQPVAVGERLPELRQRFETTLNGARCLSDRPVGNVELADRLLDDVLAWHTSTTPPEAES